MSLDDIFEMGYYIAPANPIKPHGYYRQQAACNRGEHEFGTSYMYGLAINDCAWCAARNPDWEPQDCASDRHRFGKVRIGRPGKPALAVQDCLYCITRYRAWKSRQQT